jgi:hypothetical protein
MIYLIVLLGGGRGGRGEFCLNEKGDAHLADIGHLFWYIHCYVQKIQNTDIFIL